MEYPNSPVLIGRDRHRARQFSLLAVVIFLISIVAVYIVISGATSVAPLVVYPLVISLPVVVAFGVAMVHAYLNDGLLVCMLVSVALGLGVWVPYRVGLFIEPFEQPLGLALADFYILVFTLVTGVGAFVIGAVIRRAVDHIR